MIQINNFSLSNKAVFELVKIGIGTSRNDFDFSKLTDDDWKYVFNECKLHSIALLCFDAIATLKNYIPKDIYTEWFKLAIALTTKSQRSLESQNRLVNMLETNDIPYIILKGFASAYYYPNYEKRSFGDVDFLISINDWDKAQQFFLKNGYSMDLEHHSYHTSFRNNNDYFEMHKQIAGVPVNEYGDPIREYLVGAVERYVELDSPKFRKPTDSLHAVILALHTLHHLLSKGIGLRHLCDWACFVNKTYDDSFWTDELLNVFNKFGIFNFVQTLTYTVVKYLGVQKPLWLTKCSDDLADELMMMFVNNGNFGRKKPKKEISSFMFSKSESKLTPTTKILNMIKALNNSNETMYPILKKYKILYPFIMLIRITKYMILRFKGERPSLVDASRRADYVNELYIKYELYKVEEEKE